MSDARRELIAWAGRLENECFEWWEVFRGYGVVPEVRYQRGPLYRAFGALEDVLEAHTRGVL